MSNTTHTPIIQNETLTFKALQKRVRMLFPNGEVDGLILDSCIITDVPNVKGIFMDRWSTWDHEKELSLFGTAISIRWGRTWHESFLGEFLEPKNMVIHGNTITGESTFPKKELINFDESWSLEVDV